MDPLKHPEVMERPAVFVRQVRVIGHPPVGESARPALASQSRHGATIRERSTASVSATRRRTMSPAGSTCSTNAEAGPAHSGSSSGSRFRCDRSVTSCDRVRASRSRDRCQRSVNALRSARPPTPGGHGIPAARSNVSVSSVESAPALTTRGGGSRPSFRPPGWRRSGSPSRPRPLRA